ncbi:hypothetical protein M8J77_017572 [Diaphorina citri]|nr:hypothetical protein M8J77_017572 [Diaphorina citri]
MHRQYGDRAISTKLFRVTTWSARAKRTECCRTGRKRPSPMGFDLIKAFLPPAKTVGTLSACISSRITTVIQSHTGWLACCPRADGSLGSTVEIQLCSADARGFAASTRDGFASKSATFRDLLAPGNRQFARQSSDTGRARGDTFSRPPLFLKHARASGASETRAPHSGGRVPPPANSSRPAKPAQPSTNQLARHRPPKRVCGAAVRPQIQASSRAQATRCYDQSEREGASRLLFSRLLSETTVSI